MEGRAHDNHTAKLRHITLSADGGGERQDSEIDADNTEDYGEGDCRRNGIHAFDGAAAYTEAQGGRENSIQRAERQRRMDSFEYFLNLTIKSAKVLGAVFARKNRPGKNGKEIVYVGIRGDSQSFSK